MILTQQWGECAWFSILWALCRMKPDTDHEKISKEIIEESGNSASITSASAWFVRKWYIKWIMPCSYSPFLLKKMPIITSIRNVDWIETGKPPYKLTYLTQKNYASHYLAMVWPNTFVNSWGETFWDKWYFYFDQKQVKTMWQCFILVLD